MKKFLLALAVVSVAAVACNDDDDAPVPVSVTSVTINQGPAMYASMAVGAAMPTLSVTVKPDDATNKTMEWSVSANTAVTIDKNTGKLTRTDAALTEPIEVTVQARSVNGVDGTAKLYLTPEAPAGYGVIDSIKHLANFYMLDRNVGASAVGTSGNYYQWGRNAVVATEGATAVNGSFDYNVTWAAPASWATAASPCPDGWRLPTQAELELIKSLTLPYFDNLAMEDFGMDPSYTEEQAAESLRIYNMLKMANSGMFQVKDTDGDGMISAGEVSKYMASAPTFWSSDVVTGTTGLLGMSLAYNFANNLIPAVEKTRPVMFAMPVRCVR
ncbi:MAG: Ig-like domain-containing protein [Rikenellaceae bacterium]|nr:Ig-like domain-containing protein [Rikenellaceae bacterium]